jgi:hypothetical protein
MAASGVVGDAALPLCVLIACAVLCITSLLRRATAETSAEHTKTRPILVSSSAMAQTAAKLSKELAMPELSSTPEGLKVRES